MKSTEVRVIDGHEFKEMFSAATDWLEKNARDIDALNVFPVPDGDCGTNMLFTMRSGIEAAGRLQDPKVNSVAQAIARGTLMGARGNSGVILSQIWRGISASLAGKETVDGRGLAESLMLASEMAGKALNKPVEGTILTVIRESAESARKFTDTGENDVGELLATVVKTARESVAKTPDLLPALRDAGVVDAGGQGLYTLFEGAWRYLQGEAGKMKLPKPQIITIGTPATGLSKLLKTKEVPYGYSTEFLLKGTGLNPDNIRADLENCGKNLIVAGDESTVKVHIHAPDPGPIFTYAVAKGVVFQITVRNLDEQYQEFLKLQKEKVPEKGIATLAVVTGDGLAGVFRSLGVTEIVPGGQTMNPSTGDLLQAVESVPVNKVIILPNNSNIVPAANQLADLTSKRIIVVPTETIPQGIAALLAFNYEADLETNSRVMAEAKTQVKTIEVTRAVRSVKFGELDVKRGQGIAFLNGELVAASDSPLGALKQVIDRLELSKMEAIAIYYGSDTQSSEADKLGENIQQTYPSLQVEVLNGGQPHYNYIISVE